jgi:hypothetical protein
MKLKDSWMMLPQSEIVVGTKAELRDVQRPQTREEALDALLLRLINVVEKYIAQVKNEKSKD